MSRIHEALKKAEQERASAQVPNQPVPLGAGNFEPVVPVAEMLGTDYAPANGDGHVVATMPSFANAYSIEALLARCVPQPWVPDEKTMLFFNEDENARGTEQFRTLRSRLYHVREKMPLKKVLVTSALPKEGKSFTASNLAQVMVRQHGRRVLLIDADLRGPRLHMMLGTTSSPGLADYLEGRTDEFSIMQRGPMENLFFVPSGREISDPSELVANGRLQLLLQRVESLFDWVIIDSPPAVPVSDASVLAKACDGVLMVVRSNATPVDMARRARQEFPDEMLVGIVLNGAQVDVMPYTRYYYDGDQRNANESKS
jgi:protein-tyrosine kinase